jgi:hypothetical protein
MLFVAHFITNLSLITALIELKEAPTGFEPVII